VLPLTTSNAANLTMYLLDAATAYMRKGYRARDLVFVLGEEELALLRACTTIPDIPEERNPLIANEELLILGIPTIPLAGSYAMVLPREQWELHNKYTSNIIYSEEETE